MSQPHTVGSVPGLDEAIQKRNESVQPPMEVTAKRVLAGVVGACALTMPFLAQHTVAYQVCAVVVGIGAALGITSQGVRK